MAVGIKVEKIAKGLNGDDGARDRILFVYNLLQEKLQRFPGASAQIMEQTTIIEKVATQDLKRASVDADNLSIELILNENIDITAGVRKSDRGCFTEVG